MLYWGEKKERGRKEIALGQERPEHSETCRCWHIPIYTSMMRYLYSLSFMINIYVYDT